MTTEDSLEALKTEIAESSQSQRTVMVTAMALQFLECFRQFCVSEKVPDMWCTCFAFFRNGRQHPSEFGSRIDTFFAEHEAALHDSKLPAFDFLVILEGAVKGNDPALSDAVEAYFHNVGFLNLTFQRDFGKEGLDWVDLSLPPCPEVERMLEPYRAFLDGHLPQDDLLALAALHSAMDLIDLDPTDRR